MCSKSFRNRLEEAESVQRGYLLTGNQDYLRSYESSGDEAEKTLDRIQGLTHDNPQQQASIARLRSHLLAEIAELAATIQLRREQGIEPAMRRVMEGSGLRGMDEIRRAIDEMQNEERQLLASRTLTFQASIARNKSFLATDVALQFVLLTLGFLFIYRDFANRARFTVAIGKANNLLKAVVEGSGDGILAKDTEGRYQVINEAGGRFMGWSAAEILGRTDAALFDEASAKRLAEEDREVLASGRIIEYERTLTAAGQTKIIASSKAPYRDGAGQIVGVVGVFRDVTQRHHAEEELRETGKPIAAWWKKARA
jgi:PAS domain S-box-containing protein